MKSYKILLVEDDEELRRLYKDNFVHHDFEVFEAADGQAAIDEALIHVPDFVLLDLMLPKQGGIGALKVMRSLPELKQTPVFVLTALDNREYHEAAKSMIQGYYLKTQIRPMELIQKVREYLESH